MLLMHNEEVNKTRQILVEKNQIKSGVLFAKNKELIIVHNDEEYRLRITGNNKLILTK
jgi:hemin uptake protein HemP